MHGQVVVIIVKYYLYRTLVLWSRSPRNSYIRSRDLTREAFTEDTIPKIEIEDPYFFVSHPKQGNEMWSFPRNFLSAVGSTVYVLDWSRRAIDSPDNFLFASPEGQEIAVSRRKMTFNEPKF